MSWSPRIHSTNFYSSLDDCLQVPETPKGPTTKTKDHREPQTLGQRSRCPKELGVRCGATATTC